LLINRNATDESASPPRRKRLKGLHHDVTPIRRLLFGQPIETGRHEDSLLPKSVALPVFASDAISSVAYATQQILLVLGGAGLWMMQFADTYRNLTLGITAAIVLLLAIVVSSYWQTIFAYPKGGGSYIVTRDNLGVTFSLIAGAALLIGYVVTVAVSIASGVQNLLSTPVAATLNIADKPVPVAIFFIALLTFANLRGLKESGLLFATFTYLFVAVAGLMILLGIAGPYLGWEVYEEAVNRTVPSEARHPAQALAGVALIGLTLKAFATGCSAMTGTEAVADGVPAFRHPQPLNAALTLFLMAGILAFLFLGISWLATDLHVVYWEHEGKAAKPVIDQLSGAIFGKHGVGLRSGLYYLMQFSTAAVLFLAANTAFADFPRLSYFMSRDRFLPRQLANLGDKMVYSNGIVLLGALAVVLIVAFDASVDELIPLYAFGVFTAFTLSQSSMVARWFKLKTRGWYIKAAINGFGALCTGLVLLIVGYEKFLDGAWLVMLAMVVVVMMFRVINDHYEDLRARLTIIGWKPDTRAFSNTVLLLVPSLHKGIFPALRYARSLSPDCRAVHIEIDPADTDRLRREWDEYVGEDPPLVILPSTYRSIIAPILVYLDEVQKERENHMVTVVLPEFVSRKGWHSLLHNKNGLLLRYYLLNKPGVIVSNVRYFLDGRDGSADVPAGEAQEEETP